MTTTLSTHGGGAQPARIDSSGKVTGGAAMRVYGFASEAEALAAGFVCEGGPAMSVALITDAQLASGAWKLDGDPFAVVIYTAPDSLPTEGGFAVPVYPVNGWGSAPAPSGGLPDVASATLLLDLEADTLALNNGDPVSTWIDQSSAGHNFTQTGSARPTYRAGSGVPYVEFDGINDWMLGSNFADGLRDFAVFVLCDYEAPDWGNLLAIKAGNYGCSDPGSSGWAISLAAITLMDSVSDQFFQAIASDFTVTNGIHLGCGEVINGRPYFYFDGLKNQYNPDGGLVIGAGASTYLTTEPIRLCADGLAASGDNSCSGFVSARALSILIYQITDPTNWPTDRAAITAWLAARYGVTL